MVYTYDDDHWLQVGNHIIGPSVSSLFGFSISLGKNGELLAVGAPGADKYGPDSGLVTIYSYDSSALDWTGFGISLIGSSQNELCGHSVDFSSDGQHVAFGCPGASVGLFLLAGRVEIARFDPTRQIWSQYNVSTNGKGSSYHIGRSVSVSGDGNRVAYSGAVPTKADKSFPGIFVLELNEDIGEWVPYGSFIQEGIFRDRMVVATNFAGDLVAIGAVGPANEGYVTTYEAIYKGQNYPYHLVDSEYHN